MPGAILAAIIAASIGNVPLPQNGSTKILSLFHGVSIINAAQTGVFVAATDHMGAIDMGTHIGDIIEPIEGKVIQRIESPTNGIIFTLRENPVVYKGALIARVYGGKA